MCDTKLLPVQSVISTFLERKLWRPEQLYPRSYMDNLRTNLRTNGGSLSQTLAITRFGWWRWRPPLMLILLNIFKLL